MALEYDAVKICDIWKFVDDAAPRDGNGGEAGPKDRVFASVLQDFILPYPHPASHDGKFSCLISAPQSLMKSRPTL